MPMVVVIHPTGNQNVRSVLTALNHRRLLARYATALGHAGESRSLRWLPNRWREEWGRRAYALPRQLVWQSPARELVRLGAERAGWNFLIRQETGPFCTDAVYRNLDLRVAAGLEAMMKTKGIAGIYGYEDGCAASFRRGKALGLACLYDLPIAYWETGRRLLEEEAARLPAWAPTLGRMSERGMKIQRKVEELKLADVVFCPSSFVADSLPLWARQSKEVVVAHFGSPAGTADGTDPRVGAASGGGRLRVLFAGSMSQRKGLGDLFAAMNHLGRRDIELVVMGSPQAPMPFYREQYPDFTYEGTRPHAEVLRLMRSCDVLVLPSIVEGRALVMQEAMSQGLPIVITANTGGEDLIEPGQTGFLVPIRSPEAIADRLAWLADHRDQTRAMGESARLKAATYSWSNYGDEVARVIERKVQS